MTTKANQPTRKMTVAEFLPWAEAARARGEPRYELVDGIPVAMSPERSLHGQNKLAVAIALLAAVRRAQLPCHVQPDGATVVAGNHKAYEPDALVYCGDPLADDATVTPNPDILVEVISPSTGTISTRATSWRPISGYPACITICWLMPTGTSSCITGGPTPRGSQRNLPMKGSPPGLTVPVGELFEVPSQRLT
jgi:hypothetical protein